jgi:hypothetical protein
VSSFETKEAHPMPDHSRTRRLCLAALAAAPLVAGCPLLPSVFNPVPGDPDLAQGSYTHPAGGRTLTLFGGAGSGAFRGRGDTPFEVWTTSDRGANFPCEDAPLVLGITPAAACPAEGSVAAGVGRIYPRPGYAPSIYRLQVQLDGTFTVAEQLPFRKTDGEPVTGLLNPQTFVATEIPRDGDGKVIPQDPSAVDAEGLVRFPQFGGRFFFTDENATGLFEVDRTGRILKRHVPAGTESDYAAAGYPISGSLPGILAKRRLNRGIESITMIEGTRFIYFMVQSPLDNPSSAVRDSFSIRIFKAEIDLKRDGSDLYLHGEWVYPLQPASFFRDLGATDAARQRDLRVSEMLHVVHQRILVLERTDQVTGIFEIDLDGATNILGSKWDDLATSPSLEATADLAAAGVQLPAKRQRFIASSKQGAEPRFPEKMEAMAWSADGRLILINDDDFGITGQVQQINLINEVTRP